MFRIDCPPSERPHADHQDFSAGTRSPEIRLDSDSRMLLVLVAGYLVALFVGIGLLAVLTPTTYSTLIAASPGKQSK